VLREANALVSGHPNAPVFADFNFKDMDRVRTFYRIAKENGRKLVVKLKDCYYLKHLSQDPNLGVPNYDDKDIVIQAKAGLRHVRRRRLLRRGRDLCKPAQRKNGCRDQPEPEPLPLRPRLR
jgi:mRNA degradation ribonuclease J1/J2